MTILIAYVPRPEGEAALQEALRIARERGERLVLVNASPGGPKEDPALVDGGEMERLRDRLAHAGVEIDVRQYVRGNTAVEEIVDIVEQQGISMVVIGLRRRSQVGKLVLGSAAMDILRAVPCPVLAVKA